GISEWLHAIENRFSDWQVRISPQLFDKEYNAAQQVDRLTQLGNVTFNDDMHLAVSLRSFRAEHLATFVKELLDLQLERATETHRLIESNYPIVITRSVGEAKKWL